jgi:hypothetical protein
MANTEEYVKRGESTLITTTGRVFSLHHSATICYRFDEIYTPNALEMTLLSNDVKLHANDWTFLKISAVEREIDNIFCEISSLMTENIKFTPFYFHVNLCMQSPIIQHVHSFFSAAVSHIHFYNHRAFQNSQLLGKEKHSDSGILTVDRQMIGHCIQRLMGK